MSHNSRMTTWVVSLTVVVVFLTGCMPIWQGRQMEEELAEMQERQTELEEESREREEELAAMIADARAEIDELEEVLEDARQLLQRDSAELEADVRQARRHISQLRGQIEQLEFQYGRLDQSFRAFRADFDRLFAGMDADELLEQAHEFVEEGEYDMARRALQRFVEDHQNHELIWEARLELGDVFYELEMWESAGAEFSTVIDGAPSDALLAHATRRVGEVFIEMGQCSQAQLFLEEVTQQYPGTEDATKARQRLEDIEQGDCPP